MVCAASTSADRTAWVKAINAVIKELQGAAPVSGWLTKQGGRKTGRVVFSRWKRRWFVCLAPFSDRTCPCLPTIPPPPFPEVRWFTFAPLAFPF